MQWFYDPGYDYGGGLPGSPREVHGFILHKPVARFAREIGCPLVALPAGGYSDKSPSITEAGFRAIAEIERGR